MRALMVGSLSLYRNPKSKKIFITNFYDSLGNGAVWTSVGDVVEVSKEDFEKNGLDMVLSHLRKTQKPLPPSERLLAKDIRKRTRGTAEVSISLFGNGELQFCPMIRTAYNGESPKENAITTSDEIDQKLFLSTVEKAFGFANVK
jgi:hypothetical protein